MNAIRALNAVFTHKNASRKTMEVHFHRLTAGIFVRKDGIERTNGIHRIFALCSRNELVSQRLDDLSNVEKRNLLPSGDHPPNDKRPFFGA
jgi:hypothetical protein